MGYKACKEEMDRTKIRTDIRPQFFHVHQLLFLRLLLLFVLYDFSFFVFFSSARRYVHHLCRLLFPTAPKIGALREIYLSPGGVKSDTPLSRFRGVLFGLLGALQSSPSLAGDSGSSSPPATSAPAAVAAVAAAAMLDGVVVRDIPAFLKVHTYAGMFPPSPHDSGVRVQV